MRWFPNTTGYRTAAAGRNALGAPDEPETQAERDELFNAHDPDMWRSAERDQAAHQALVRAGWSANEPGYWPRFDRIVKQLVREQEK